MLKLIVDLRCRHETPAGIAGPRETPQAQSEVPGAEINRHV
jgi:hypothetical protein